MLKKYLSQHLIKDRNILEKMVRLSGIDKDDVVLEIGSGQGDLTECLCEKAGFVYGIEIDRTFKRHLEEIMERHLNLKVLFCDFLNTRLTDFYRFSGDKKIKVFGNIPYKITAPIIFKIIDERNVVDGVYLTVQKEIGERIVSKPGYKTYGAISVICQLLANVKILMRLKPTVFVPPPKVDSVFLSVLFKDNCHDISDGLIRFIRICFENRRKYLKNTLLRYFDSEKVYGLYNAMGFSHKIRAEQLEPSIFKDIYRFLNG